MSEKKLFSDRRWHDPPVATVTGHEEPTEEEKRQADIDFEKILKEYGVMKPDESIEIWRRREEERKNK